MNKNKILDFVKLVKQLEILEYTIVMIVIFVYKIMIIIVLGLENALEKII